MNDTSKPTTTPADGKPLVTPASSPMQQNQAAPKPDADKSKEQQK